MSRRSKGNAGKARQEDTGGGGTTVNTLLPQYRHKDYSQQELTDLEDRLCKAGNLPRADSSSKSNPSSTEPSSEDRSPLDMSGPWRPAYGIEGRPITVHANYMQLFPSPTRASSLTGHARYLEIIFHSYSISIVPDVRGRKRAQVVRLWLEQMLPDEPDEPTPLAVATDFQGRIITDRVLSVSAILRQVQYRREGDLVAHANAIEYKVTLDAIESMRFQFSELLQYLGTVGLSQDISQGSLSHASLNTEPGAVATPADWTQALNIILNHYSRMQPTIRTIVGSGRVFGIAPAGQASVYAGHTSPSLRIGGALEAIRGFHSSTRLATGRVLINVNVATAVFFRGNIPLVVLMNEFVQKKYSSDTKSSRWSAMTLASLDKFIRGLRIRATHMPNRPTTTYSIYGLAKPYQTIKPRTKTPQPRKQQITKSDERPNRHPPIVEALGSSPHSVQFWYSPDRTKPDVGSHITVASYFATQYPTLKLDLAYPVVNVGNAEHPIFLPVEACVVLPGQVAARAQLDERQKTEFLNFAVRAPADSASDILEKAPHVLGFASSVNSQNSKVGMIHRFGLAVNDKKLIQVRARILPAPSLTFFKLLGDTATTATPEAALFRPHPQKANWNLKDSKFSSGAQIGTNWACLALAAGQQDWQQIQSDVTNALQRFVTTMAKHGINVGRPSVIDGVPNNSAQISNMLQKLLEQSRGNVKMVLIVLQDSSTPTYNAVKYLGDVLLGVCTVCVDFSKFTKMENWAYLSNVALKVNLKLGGCNHRLALGPVSGNAGGRTGGSGGLFRGVSSRRGPGCRQGPQSNQPHRSGSSSFTLSPIDPATTMIVGVDVTHPSPSSTSSAPSIAAMVASTDKHLSQWPAELRVQEHAREEMVANTTLEDMTICHLKRWQERHKGTLPRSVLVYRDGVSEGQYALVVSEEIPQLRRAFDHMYGMAPTPPLTVVIVGKRHNTRFYPADGEADGSTHRDQTGNCLPGTVVDRGMTLASSWDFFLQAHRAIKGTARPAHYHVVCDEIFRSRCADPHSGGSGASSGNDKMKAFTTKFKKMTMGVDLSRRSGAVGDDCNADLETTTQNASDALQRVTQALCFIFGRAAGAVGIVTPAYYADLACDRARRYLTKWYDSIGDDGKGGQQEQEPEEILAEQAQRIAVHARLRETMFYI
ncbi:rna interference and silencing protein [Ophiostoma piceae UAMH 11346]|uniref:Rna interference and silencing protein n=1 Tax=Ophiostoma piceae (strain UAMH 11346) TaxID=1262450 RepID=S3DA86_OPHP1|nr:rna interference and silencing protein [Ophiostoma piceae UAMH 11346]